MDDSRALRVMAVGDIMVGDSSHFLGRGVASHVRRHGVGYPLADVRHELDAADIVIGNLESPLSALPAQGPWQRVYRGAAEMAAALRVGRCTVLTTANNHVLEHGSALYAETRRLLSASGILHTGFDSGGGDGDPPLEFDCAGLRVRVLAASLIRDLTGRAVPVDAVAGRLVSQLRDPAADLRLVSLHWGHEYSPAASPAQRRLARVLVEAGADLVLGHHPHVLQPVEAVDRALVAYSLGNFLFDQDWTEATRLGGILDVRLGVGGSEGWTFRPTVCGRDCRPRPATEPEARRARAVIEDTSVLDEAAYDRQLARLRRRSRLAMKAELVRHLPRVSGDTWRFLLTKRFRPRPRLGDDGSADT